MSKTRVLSICEGRNSIVAHSSSTKLGRSSHRQFAEARFSELIYTSDSCTLRGPLSWISSTSPKRLIAELHCLWSLSGWLRNVSEACFYRVSRTSLSGESLSRPMLHRCEICDSSSALGGRRRRDDGCLVNFHADDGLGKCIGFSESRWTPRMQSEYSSQL